MPRPVMERKPEGSQPHFFGQYDTGVGFRNSGPPRNKKNQNGGTQWPRVTSWIPDDRIVHCIDSVHQLSQYPPPLQLDGGGTSLANHADFPFPFQIMVVH